MKVFALTIGTAKSSKALPRPPVGAGLHFSPVPKSSWDRNLPVPVGLSGSRGSEQEADMNGLIYLVGLIVVILAILSFFGLR